MPEKINCLSLNKILMASAVEHIVDIHLSGNKLKVQIKFFHKDR